MTLLSAAAQSILPLIMRELLNRNVPVDNADAPLVAHRVAEALAPVIINKANAEPWWQSNVTWGALVSIATGLLALAGYTLAPEDVDQIIIIGTAGGTAIGGLWTLYGRWKAKKPIGQ